jgi:hypothetical protein
LNAARDALRLQERQRGLDRLRSVEQDAVEIGVGLQDRGEQSAVAAVMMGGAWPSVSFAT